MPVPTQADRALEVMIDGRTLPGPWRSKSGGEVTAPDDKIYPGHQESAVSVGGSPSVGNITLGAVYDYAKWHELSFWLESRVGPGAATITEIMRDKNKHAFGRPVVRTASLIRMQRPEYGAEDGATVAELELEFSVDGP
jgi:hypothetical protein